MSRLTVLMIIDIGRNLAACILGIAGMWRVTHRDPAARFFVFNGEHTVNELLKTDKSAQTTETGDRFNTAQEGDQMPVTHSHVKQPLVALGKLLATPAALELLTRAEQTPLEFLARHSRGDWGECDAEDGRENDFSVKAGFRILSVYRTHTGEKPYIITETDRSVTILLCRASTKIERAIRRATASSPKHQPSTPFEKIDA